MVLFCSFENDVSAVLSAEGTRIPAADLVCLGRGPHVRWQLSNFMEKSGVGSIAFLWQFKSLRKKFEA